MEFFKPGRVYDFMRVRVYWIALSITLVVLSTISVFYPGPNYGTDFRGGTEVEIAFLQKIDIGRVRARRSRKGASRHPTSSRSSTRRTRTTS